MKLILCWLFAIVLVLTNGCTQAQTTSQKNILIVYLSRTNNTKAVADIIHKHVGGKLVAIELEKPYPKNYRATVEQVMQENSTGYLPPLKTKIDDINSYDVVFIGFPTWGMKLPPPVKSFLHDHDLTGKTIVPFNTNAGYGAGSGFETVRSLCPNSNILEGFEIKGGEEREGKLLEIKDKKSIQAEAEVIKWLKKIELLNE
jgi:flavodoxin